jgi:hypothetical protein
VLSCNIREIMLARTSTRKCACAFGSYLNLTMCVFLYLTLTLPLNTKMAKTVLMDGEEACVDLPKCVPKNSATLIQADSNEPATLPSQKQVVETFQLAEAAKRAAEMKLAVEATHADATPSPSTSREGSPIVTSVSKASAPLALPHSKKSQRAYVSDEEDNKSDNDDKCKDAHTNPKLKGSFPYCYLRNGMILTDLEFQQKKHVHLL